jgi:Tfp pilus assembly protein PilF
MFTLIRILLLAIAMHGAMPAGAQGMQHHAKDAVVLGWNYFKKGDADTALRRFNQALIIDPNFAPAYFGIAYVYSVQDKLDLAIQNYRKSIEKDPTFSHSYSNLGLSLLYAGKPTEALPNLKKALDIDFKNGDAHVNIALYYFGIGDYPSSWQHIHLAQQYKAMVNPNFLRDLRDKLPEPPISNGGENPSHYVR